MDLDHADHSATLVAPQFSVFPRYLHDDAAAAINSRRLVSQDGECGLKAVHADIVALPKSSGEHKAKLLKSGCGTSAWKRAGHEP